ncbi:fibronectin type III domain-containing protein [Candidatus Saccharibacteria bacterium]|nr:fibronectin type III domain-containing protein [Candidatus Saccharibacteria bacterium]
MKKIFGSTKTSALIVTAAVFVVGLLAGFSQTVWAGVYGAGPYGACDYGGTGTCDVPGGIENLTLTPGTNQITATWSPPIDDGGSAVTGYIVGISADGGGTWPTTDTTTNTTYTFTGLNPAVTYTIRVYAVNAAGDGVIVYATGRPAFITLTMPGVDPSISVTPTASGSFSSVSYAPSVETNTGYQMTLSTSSAVTNLVKGGDVVAASTGTVGSPITLAADSWGFRIDGLGGFGAGPTLGSSNAAALPNSWAGVPPLASAATIATGAATSGQAVNIWFGLGASTSKPSGSYTQTLVITVVGG